MPRIVTTTVTRRARIPDEVRIARCLRAPELGPRILFFSGGSALRGVSRALKQLTHNSVHLITPFDSGGSSAALREAFGMLSVGDLRNRLIALAEETALGNLEIYELFGHRLPRDLSPVQLAAQLDDLVQGRHPLVARVPQPMRQIIGTHLRHFARNMPASFDLRGASVGNLILAGGFLEHQRDIHAVIFSFAKLVEVHGTVRPTVADDLHLAADCADGSRTVGQHRLTGKQCAPLTSPIVRLQIVRSLADDTPAEAAIDAETRGLIEGADLICYPVGSFYSSVVANLLPAGVGRAIARARCPKVYLPNLGQDPEQLGVDLAAGVRTLADYARADAGPELPVDAFIDHVLLDREAGRYAGALDLDAIAALGVTPLDLPLARADDPEKLDASAVARALISLSA